MTLQQVPTEILAESLLAVQDLRRKYLGEKMTTAYAAETSEQSPSPSKCPLCLFHRTHKDTAEVSDTPCCCPWEWIEGHQCEEWDGTDGNLESYDDHPVPDRLARIDRWELAITEELAQRRLPNAAIIATADELF